MTVGSFRDFLLSDRATTEVLARLAPAITPEMAAAVAKIMRNQDLILAAQEVPRSSRASATPSACPARWPCACSPTIRPTTCAGITASIVDGLMYGCGDAVIGINPASDSVPVIADLLKLLDDLIAPLRDSDARRACSPTSRRRSS